MRTVAVENDERWEAIARRDRSAGFFYSVRTTGVYCRPSCGARMPRRENVEFYASREEAERAGFRPCKRCRPDQPPLAAQRAAIVEKVCRLIEQSPEPPALDELVQAAGLSRFHFHRLFTAVTGLTPKAYAAAHRAKRVREELAAKPTVTEAMYDAGFNSSGRFYAASPGMLGMTPTRFRNGGANERIRFAVGECSLGSILVAASEKGICAIFLGDNPDALVRELERRFPKAELTGGDNAFEDTVAKVVGFVEAPGDGLDLPLDIRGTAFQHRVWQALRSIPAGSRVSYAEIAQRIGAPGAVRGVAQACASNAIAVAIPCHRVVRSDGGLSGYRWGVERKQALLDVEARQ